MTSVSASKARPKVAFDLAAGADPCGVVSCYREGGLVLLRDALDAAKLEELRSAMVKLFALHARGGEDIHATCARLATEDKPLLYRIFVCAGRAVALDGLKSDCLRWAELLHPGRAYVSPSSSVLFAPPRDERLSYGWHQEISYTPGFKNLINFWFPVFDAATRQNGTMSVLLGSHRHGALPYTEQKPSPDGYKSRVPVNIDEMLQAHPEFHCEVRTGDLIIFHPDLVHRSNPNCSSRTRFTGTFNIMAVEEIPETMASS